MTTVAGVVKNRFPTLVQTGSIRITSTSEKMERIIFMEQVNIMGGIDMKEKTYEQVLEEFNDIDKVNNPSHYKGRFGLEAIEVVKNFVFGLEGVEGFYWGNAIKYLLRFQKKNGLEDLKKARKNLDWLIEELESTE